MRREQELANGKYGWCCRRSGPRVDPPCAALVGLRFGASRPIRALDLCDVTGISAGDCD